jgi:hypothetical protein
MTRLVALVLGAVLLAGCSTLRVYDTVDLSNKTITVPPGGGLTGAIKERLAKDGWKLVVYRGPEVTQGKFGDETRLERFNTFKTRYTLFIKWRQVDFCIFGGGVYVYDMSLVDNETASEVLTLSGRGCEGIVADKFQEALNAPRK